MTWGHRYKKIRDIQIVDTYVRIAPCEFQKSLDLWCVFDRLSNFEKRNLRSGHLMWPRGVTFGVIGSSFFFGKVSNCWLNSYGKFGVATRRRFLAICEKPEGGGADRARYRLIQQFDIVRWKFFWNPSEIFWDLVDFVTSTTRHFWSKIGQTSRVCGRRSF